jgi:molybdopterin synthase catalytic subunit
MSPCRAGLPRLGPRSRAPPGKPGTGFGTIASVQGPEAGDWVAIVTEPLPVEAATLWATTPASGAVVTFLGVVRDHSEGREGVRGLTYEAYEEAALARLTAVVDEARARWPEVERFAVLHRLGDIALSEASVAVVASSPHRAEAFEAARFCIDTLKETVPIWKREHWEGGSDWATCSHHVRPVSDTDQSAEQSVEQPVSYGAHA